MKNEFYYLGKITKLFGLKGEVIFFFDVDDIYEYEQLQSVYIELNNDKVPFRLDSLTIKSHNQAIVRIGGVKDTNSATFYINKNLFLPVSSLPKLSGNKFYFHEIIGFSVIDKVKGNIGIVDHVNDQTAQSLLIIMNGEKEILFPLVDDLISKIDRKNKILYINSPEGLLDIYL